MTPQLPRIDTAKAIQRRTGRTFHLATRLLPERARLPTYALYAFFRVADDVVDDPDPSSVADQRRDLAAVRAQALGEREPTGEALEAFAAVREAHDLDDREIDIFLDAMARDLEQDRYDTAAELDEYLRGSSVAVAHLLLDVFAPDLDPAARPHAAALAEAFQLTNFLRDVREDVAEYDRIYLPRETLQRHGVDHAAVESLTFSEGMADVIREELERTEARYREGVAGIRYLPEDVQFGVLLAAVLYAEHHRLIRRQGYDVVSQTPSLSTARRLALAARTWYHWRRSHDPEAVFEAVSAVPETAPSGRSTGSRLAEETTTSEAPLRDSGRPQSS
ncbi:phytoene/squalene synthase family protein [Natronomonas salina]|uniref:phytoene/squalene synthase family protein n=1 Tax=Natronomonas salina TaxID=1710540 RepID=UPI0015B56C84|nr:phytoene/squalene synthase family protein [Natronomonas salina]QLD90651.1 phytoene/squalene synthase family protein [Natronomonas salina]